MKLGERYEVVRAITSGGMGSIYEGRDIQSGGRVAIKQMLEHLMEGEQAAMFRSKFDSEVEFLRSLSHPGIPRLYDSFVLDGVYYIVMEFVVGRNLDQELEERLQLTGQPFSADQIIRDSRQVLDILSYLHGQDPPLVHRDIKPANLIREHPSGRIKLVDFGMARLLLDNQTQTQLGTLGYSPLEQLQGKAEQRSDLYALGATMHHLITGVVPTVLNIPPVNQIRPDIEPAMAGIIDRACATEVNIRFANAKDMLNALDELRPHLPMMVDAPVKLKPLPRNDEPTEPAPLSRLGPPPNLPEPEPVEPAPPPPTVQVNEYLRGEPLEAVAARSERQPETQTNWTLGRQMGVIGALSALAFLIGWGVGHRPKAASVKTPTPVSTPTLNTPESTPNPEVTQTPESLQLPTPTPTVAVVVPATPPPAPPPKPKPKPKPKPTEEPQEHSLDGPSYPTATRNTGNTQGSVGLLDSNAKIQINLDSDWGSVGGFQQARAFHRSFRKQKGAFEFTFDIKGYSAEERPDRYRNSFKADHRGWTPYNDLGGVDLAFLQSSGRYHKVEALTAKQGQYYWYRFTGKGSGLGLGEFRQELDSAWADISLLE